MKKKLPTASKGRPSILKTTKEVVMSFFKLRHYHLWTYKDIFGLYSSENELQITYHTIQKIVSEEKHFLSASSTPEDDCRCEKCENLELLLHSVKK